MRTCGVEIKGSEAIISLLSLDDGLFQIPDCRVRKVTLEGGTNTQAMRHFQFTFAKLMTDYKIEKVVIRERPTKGKFAGGAPGFKIEAAIQLVEGLDVELVTGSKIKEALKRNPLQISLTESGLKIFQEGAFNTAYAFLMTQMYPSLDSSESKPATTEFASKEPKVVSSSDEEIKPEKVEETPPPPKSPWG